MLLDRSDVEVGLLIAANPLVAALAAHAMHPAELSYVDVASLLSPPPLPLENKLNSLLHGVGLLPGHAGPCPTPAEVSAIYPFRT
jgi:hypothetical protein